MIMTNDIGIHIGYSVSPRDTHYIFHQDVAFDSSDSDTDVIALNRLKEYKELFETSPSFEERISDKQLEVVKYYWDPF